jgi:transcriptional regulator
MYTPPAYAEPDLAVLHARMREWSFATLVTFGENGINATHLPFLLEAPSPGSQGIAGDPADGPARNGTLITHFARANAQLHDLRAGAPVLVVFQGPHAFVSPSWYVNQQTFPTWNYTAIHARGKPQLVEDDAGVRDVLDRTVALYDTPLGGAWQFPAMPETLTGSRMRAIVAVRIPIDSLEGKMKLNQDKTVADRLGVIAALEKQGDAQSLAVARMIREQPAMNEHTA